MIYSHVYQQRELWYGFFILRQIQHRLWLEREAIAQEVFRKKKLDEERRLREKIEQEVCFPFSSISNIKIQMCNLGVGRSG